MPATSGKQRRFFGFVRAIQKGEATGSKKAQDVAENISAADAGDFASKPKSIVHKAQRKRRSGY